MIPENQRKWWKEAVVYQIYPRSFMDSDDDGKGDLKGITSKLDYIKDLGIDVIWLGPVYKSPNDDMGYDISDYYDIMDDFGTMEDFDELLAGMKERGLRLVMDLVVNHSSDEHQWFREALKSKDNRYRDYYIWKQPLNGDPPNDWLSFFSGSAWELDETSGEYYLHLFSKKQPDLNWENPELRQEIYKMMKFWLDKGVDGFRMDVISLISKYQDFPSLNEGQNNFRNIYANGPRVHEFLQEMNREVLQHYDIMTVGEAVGVPLDEAPLYVGADRNELNMIFHFEHIDIDRVPGQFFTHRNWPLTELKKIIVEWDQVLRDNGWNSIYLGNHDWPRTVSRFGNDTKYRVESAKMLATLIMSLRGTPYVYNGDEIGMTNCHFNSIDEFKDIQTLNAYNEAADNGADLDEFIRGQNRFSRDHARTPMQWDDSKNAGFSEADSTWLKVNPNYTDINVAADVENPNSILNYYRKLIRLRKDNPDLVYGEMELIEEGNEKVFAFYRRFENKTKIVLLSFSDDTTEIPIDDDLSDGKMLISNYDKPSPTGNSIVLDPYEAMIIDLE